MSGHHHHHHQPQSYNKAFAIAVIINFAFVIVEASFGWVANSISLLADAMHNMSDVLGLGLAWLANWLVTRQAREHFSYGYKRTTILATLTNALLLISSSLFIFIESINKLLHPHTPHEVTMIWVALLGIAINTSTALLFLRDRHKDLNIKGAFLHLAYDAVVSLGVVVAGVLILVGGWVWLDPAVGIIIVITILVGTWSLLRDSINLLLDAVPQNIEINAVRQYLCKLPGVESVHDLHIWGLSTAECALTAHLVMPETPFTDDDFHQINDQLQHQFNIHHVTLQVERGHPDAKPCERSEVCC